MTTSIDQSTIECNLVAVPGVLNFNRERYFEVKPGRRSPIFINLKATLAYASVRTQIAAMLASRIDARVDRVGGIESGGSYYAAAVADALGKPLFLFRRQPKSYAEEGSIVGPSIHGAGLTALIDDVIVTGSTVQAPIEYLRHLGHSVSVFCVLNYGLRDEPRRRLQAPIESLTSLESFCKAAEMAGMLESADVSAIRQYVLSLDRGMRD